jgi:hypothetical protein
MKHLPLTVKCDPGDNARWYEIMDWCEASIGPYREAWDFSGVSSFQHSTTPPYQARPRPSLWHFATPEHQAMFALVWADFG